MPSVAGHPRSLPSFWAAVLRIATPLIFGTLGVLLCERAGVLNLGIEGIMVAGAMTGWLAVYLGRPTVDRRAVAALTGARSACCMRLLTVPLGLSQHVTGLGITLLATSLPISATAWLCPRSPRRRRSSRSPLPIPGCRAAVARAGAGAADAADLLAFVVRHAARLGAVPHAARPGAARCRREPGGGRSAGLSRRRACASAPSIAGSRADGRGRRLPHLSAFNAFFFDMVNGRGWICVALVVFASWRPGKALLGALLFGAFDALQLRLQQYRAASCPTRSS